MKDYIVPIIIFIVGALVMAVAIRYYIHDKIYVQNKAKQKSYLAPNVSYFILSGLWLVLSIYLTFIIFIQLSE